MFNQVNEANPKIKLNIKPKINKYYVFDQLHVPLSTYSKVITISWLKNLIIKPNSFI